MPKIEAQMRAQIAEFLPNAIETALISYQVFADKGNIGKAKENIDKAKEFKTHHDACKVAIAHIELLIKLAKWADLPDPKIEGASEQQILKSLIENGQKELSRI